jgi:8-oxo-dGTP pyrophosphatase MutT (NUDIX family)
MHLPYNNQNPWKITKSEEIYDTPWIKLVRHEVIHPSGNPGVYSVTHFKNLAIGVLPLDDDNNTWLVGQYRFPLNKYSWEIPEGGGALNVHPVESAQRELKEETGICAKEFVEIQRMYLSNSATDELAILYVAKGLSFGEAQPEESEELNCIKIPFEEVYQKVLSGEITDSLTVVAVLKTKLMLLEGKI